MTRAGITPLIKDWYFIHSQDGNPVDNRVVKKLLSDLKEKGSLNLAELNIGIAGKSENSGGNSIRVNGIHNRILKLSLVDDSFKVTTATYQEFIAGEPADMKEADYQASASRMQAHII